MQLREINSVDSFDITNELRAFYIDRPIFSRSRHMDAARNAVNLIDDLNYNATEALSEVERLSKVVDDLKKNNSELNVEAVGLSHDKYELEKRIEEDAKTISLSKTNYIALQKRFDAQTGALNKVNTALISVEEKYRVAVEEYQTLDKVNQELNTALDNYDKTVAKMEKEVFDTKQASLEKDADIVMLNTRVKQLIIHSNEIEAKAKKGDEDTTFWKKKYENLCRKLEELSEEG